ncbi:MAG: nucleotide exchange factor GrpE [Nitrospirota bacterium]|nr:nucleotide exchange factor GrpE [Nitrospirota bacterium]
MVERDVEGSEPSPETEEKDGQDILLFEDSEEAASTASAGDESAAVRELQERYVRLSADFDNYRKRMTREREEARKYALEGFIKDLLPVIDNLERAIAHASSSPGDEGNASGLLAGVEMTLKQFKGVLEKVGAREMASVGVPFDPSCHEAVAHVESSEHENNVIIQEFQKGYYLADRVLRPAMVSVAKRVESSGNSETISGNA